MRILNILYILLLLMGPVRGSAQQGSTVSGDKDISAFKPGEWLKFRIHYGILNASFATIHLTSETVGNIPVYHVVGKGRTTGFASIFFKVDDTYESYFSQQNGRPYRFIRNIYEGGYTRDAVIDFDHDKGKALFHDRKNERKKEFDIGNSVQDLLSAFYYLRNTYDADGLVIGKSIELDILFDDDGIFKLRLKYLGKETLKTKFGRIECLKFRPIVQSGRVFKEEESLSLWVSNDRNKIPIRIQADLMIGSIKADLEAYNSLNNQFSILMEN
ncbi:MAG: DUF3108 domain-containing protein [Robiginitalea sp.]|jgi:hypothetical protein